MRRLKAKQARGSWLEVTVLPLPERLVLNSKERDVLTRAKRLLDRIGNETHPDGDSHHAAVSAEMWIDELLGDYICVDEESTY